MESYSENKLLFPRQHQLIFVRDKCSHAMPPYTRAGDTARMDRGMFWWENQHTFHILSKFKSKTWIKCIDKAMLSFLVGWGPIRSLLSKALLYACIYLLSQASYTVTNSLVDFCCLNVFNVSNKRAPWSSLCSWLFTYEKKLTIVIRYGCNIRGWTAAWGSRMILDHSKIMALRDK